MKLTNIKVFMGMFLALLSSVALASGTEEVLEKIVNIAKVNTERIDNFSEVRKEIQPLIDELKNKIPQRPLAEDLELKKGTWKQIWTDDADDLRANNAFQSANRDRTFQVVFDGGIFYNISEIKTVLGVFTGFLRGTYNAAANGNSIDIEFTKIGLARGTVGNFESIFGRATNVESGSDRLISLPGEQRYPRGPVGAQGNIRTIYIDNDYRIDEGFNKADGVVDLFVLERIRNTNN